MDSTVKGLKRRAIAKVLQLVWSHITLTSSIGIWAKPIALFHSMATDRHKQTPCIPEYDAWA